MLVTMVVYSKANHHDDRPSTWSGLGGWFEEGHRNETTAVVQAVLDDGSVIDVPVTKASGNTDLSMWPPYAPEDEWSLIVTTEEVTGASLFRSLFQYIDISCSGQPQ